jgi:spoIIIJ-associated protein
MPWIEKEGRTVEEATEAAVAQAAVPRDELEIEVIREGAKGLFGLGGEPALVRVRPRSEARDFRDAFRSDVPVARPVPSTPAPVSPVEQASEDEEPEGLVVEAAPTPEPEGLVVEGAPTPEPEDSEGEDRASLDERQEGAARVAEDLVKGVLERMGLDGDVNTRVAGGTVYIEVFGDNMGILIGRGGATLEALQELVRAAVQRRLKARQSVVVDVEAYWERRRGRRRPAERDSRQGDSRQGSRSG